MLCIVGLGRQHSHIGIDLGFEVAAIGGQEQYPGSFGVEMEFRLRNRKVESPSEEFLQNAQDGSQVRGMSAVGRHQDAILIVFAAMFK